MAINLMQKFLKLESASGIILLLAALMAMIWANSPLGYLHHQFISTWLFWINDGLMTLFFLVVGLELKQSYLSGNLSTFKQIALPAVAAVGGMLVPIAIYIGFNPAPPTMNGWATPVATDIAFALGVLTLFGSRVPSSLKIFLLALAIFDDIGAILLIVGFYSAGVNYLFLFQSLVLAGLLFLFNKLNVRHLFAYLLIGAWLWLCLLQAGIHPTIAGVVLGLSIPGGKSTSISPLHRLQNVLHPWVAYLIMPLFALANAGVQLGDLTWSIFLAPVVLGISLGLFLGKQIGVFSFSWLLIRMKLARLPKGATWQQLYGVAVLCGIGFTMSLFLGTLSFENKPIYLTEVRLGVILGSLLSILYGAAILLAASVFKKE